MQYRAGTEGLRPEDFEGFFVDWPRRPSGERLLGAMARAVSVWVALDGERPIGFVYAVGDGELAASIPLLEVLPEYQGRGVGTELMKRVLADLDGTYMVDLTCDAELTDYYRRFGLTPLTAMARRDASRL